MFQNIQKFFRSIFAVLFASTWFSQSGGAADSYLWLEELKSKNSLDWVEAENARTLGVIQKLDVFDGLLRDAKHLFYAEDRVPFSSQSYGDILNFWTDEKNQHGVIRRTTLDEYQKDKPKWETILDLDELSKKENENWIYKGVSRLDRKSTRRLLHLSRDGKDAIVVREFDYESKKFIEDGFNVPEAKTDVTPLDENQVFIGSEFGPDFLTESGYPRVVKLWKRGQPLSEAKIVFEGKKTDISVSAFIVQDRKKKYAFFNRGLGMDDSEYYFLHPDNSITQLPIPTTAKILDIRDELIYVELPKQSEAEGRVFPAKSVIRFPLTAQNLADAEILFTAGQTDSIHSVHVSDRKLFVNLLRNVHNEVLEIKQNTNGNWISKSLPFPKTGSISFSLKDEMDPSDYTELYYSDHLTPYSQYIVHTEEEGFRLELLKASPKRFDSSSLEVTQNFAVSKDGTQIPYFLIGMKKLNLNGTHPTILYGYGGFGVSLEPTYNAAVGKLWLEQGGTYVIANIRGGGEFGHDWHESATKHHRQRAFDDFIAVAEDLISRGITSPAHLGISGGSNGGLLVGAVMAQRPELFNGALMSAPLLDMARYVELPPGASWISEYGDPRVQADLDYILTYSPYQKLDQTHKYPSPFLTTSTADDRVHPGHARKMAAKLKELGSPFYFYENTIGGHAGSAKPDDSAFLLALEYSYFWMQLK